MRPSGVLRFLLESLFIVAIAAAAGAAHSSPSEIGIAVGSAFAIVAAAEWLASRRRPRASIRERVERAAPARRLPRAEPEPAAAPRREGAVRRPRGGRRPATAPPAPLRPPPPAAERPHAVAPRPERPTPEPRREQPPPAAPLLPPLVPERPHAVAPRTEPPALEQRREEPAPAAPPPPPAQPPRQPVRWNVFDLESRARAVAGSDPDRDDEWRYLLLYLRDLADIDGLLPPGLDGFVRESFGELVAAGAG